MKKKTKYLGFSLISVYILIFVYLVYIGYQQKEVSDYAFVPSYLMGFFGIVILPFIYKTTLASSLANKTSQAILISKKMLQRGSVYPRSLWMQYFLIFKLSNGSIKSFAVSDKVFHIVSENDIGTLVYRGKGVFKFYIDFIKQ